MWGHIAESCMGSKAEECSAKIDSYTGDTGKKILRPVQTLRGDTHIFAVGNIL
jgi:hypothetical protein